MRERISVGGDHRGQGEPLVLIADADTAHTLPLVRALGRDGIRSVVVIDGQGALERFRADPPALVILELVLPGSSGLDLCRTIRAASAVPIMVVTRSSAESDRVAALELGADDCVTKPVSARELVARVRTLLRRAYPRRSEAAGAIAGGPVRVDLDRHEVHVRGEPVTCAPMEFELLVALVTADGRVLTRDFLIANVWGLGHEGSPQTVDVHVRRLRRKIERDPARPEHLLTVRGAGYRFVVEPSGPRET